MKLDTFIANRRQLERGQRYGLAEMAAERAIAVGVVPILLRVRIALFATGIALTMRTGMTVGTMAARLAALLHPTIGAGMRAVGMPSHSHPGNGRLQENSNDSNGLDRVLPTGH